MSTLEDFNRFLESKLNPQDTAESAQVHRIELSPSGYIDRFGKPPILAIELKSRLPRRVDDFPGFTDLENKVAVEKIQFGYGRGQSTVKYVVWK